MNLLTMDMLYSRVRRFSSKPYMCMKTKIILEIIGGLCLLGGCVLYLRHNKKEDETTLGILSIILTAIGIGLFIGVSNIPYNPPQENNTEIIEEDVNENQIDP